jgi:FtsH-binding integral membrane protein
MISKTISTGLKLLRPSLMAVPAFRFSTRDRGFTPAKQETMTTNHFISQNVGVNRFLQNVYSITGLSILGALSSSYIAMSLFPYAMVPMSIGGMIASLVGLIGSSVMKPEYVCITEQINNKEKIETIVSRSSPLRIGLYAMGVMGLGLGAAPLLAFASAINPSIIPTCLGLTAAIFGGASLMAYRMPKDSMLGYGRALTGSLLGLIGLQLVGMGSAFIMGPNPFSMMLLNSSSYLAVGLFSVFVAYDTHFAIKMYEMKQPDQLGMSVQFLLDFWNIFTSLVRIFSSD